MGNNPGKSKNNRSSLPAVRNMETGGILFPPSRLQKTPKHPHRKGVFDENQNQGKVPNDCTSNIPPNPSTPHLTTQLFLILRITSRLATPNTVKPELWPPSYGGPYRGVESGYPWGPPYIPALGGPPLTPGVCGLPCPAHHAPPCNPSYGCGGASMRARGWYRCCT